MAERHDEHSRDWVKVHNRETGLHAQFPQRPLEVLVDIPFQNTPAKGRLHLYSVPTQKGVLVFSTLTSQDEVSIEKKELLHFLEKTLVPHLFYEPQVFQKQQKFHYSTANMHGQEAASFVVTYLDHGQIKRMEGIAFIKDDALCLGFYLGADEEFDQELLQQFIDSLQF